MAIAKYRKAEYPGEWFLTDFTMEQVEGRLAALESDNARLREALRECVDSLCEYVDVDTPGKMSDRKARGQKAVAHACEVMGK